MKTRGTYSFCMSKQRTSSDDFKKKIEERVNQKKNELVAEAVREELFEKAKDHSLPLDRFVMLLVSPEVKPHLSTMTVGDLFGHKSSVAKKKSRMGSDGAPIWLAVNKVLVEHKGRMTSEEMTFALVKSHPSLNPDGRELRKWWRHFVAQGKLRGGDGRVWQLAESK